MKILRIVTFLLFLVPVLNVQAQSNFGGEIVSYETFGEGMMVTRAKIVPLSGVVTNMFFFNRADEPWKNNEWYEYDWEIRGAFPFSGWSQIRVRQKAGTVLRDAPDSVETTVNLSNELLHYVLIRRDNRYVYDIRRDFDVSTYNYNNAAAHGGNSESLLSDGPRVYETGDRVDHIPEWKRLDFSLGITAFDSKWSGRLPNGDYSREAEIDFTRFYTFSGTTLNTTPEWNDEFNGDTLDFGRWFTADWTFAATQFRPDNVKVQDGRLFLRVNRGESFWEPAASGNSESVVLSDSTSQSSSSVPEVQVTSIPVVDTSSNTENEAPSDTESQSTQSMPEVQVTSIPVVDTSGITENSAPSDTASQSTQSVPEVQLRSIPAGDSVSNAVVDEFADSVQSGSGSADLMTLWLLSVCGLFAARRRKIIG